MERRTSRNIAQKYIWNERMKKTNQSFEPWHEISNNVVCATSKGSDQPAHTRSLIRAFASRLNILSVKLLTEHLLNFLAENGAAQDGLSLHLSKYHIVGNHMSELKFLF